MLPLTRAAFVNAGHNPKTLNAPHALNSTESGIVDSSPPAADDEHISGNELIAAHKRVKDKTASKRWSHSRPRNNAPGDAHSVGGAHPTARVSYSVFRDAHPDAHPPAVQPDQPASQHEGRGGIWQDAEIPSEIEMDEAEYAYLNYGPLSLVPSRDMVFEPCAELENNLRPKALFVYPEAQFLGLSKDKGAGLTQLRAWTKYNFAADEAKSIRAVGISTCYSQCTPFYSVDDVPPGKNLARKEILANIKELRSTFMQVDDGKPRFTELVFPADGQGYFVIDTVPSVRSINEAKNETVVRLEIRIFITALLRDLMIDARSWSENLPQPEEQTQDAGSPPGSQRRGFYRLGRDRRWNGTR